MAQTMAEKLAAAAAESNANTSPGQAGSNVPQVNAVDSTTVAGKSKSGLFA